MSPMAFLPALAAAMTSSCLQLLPAATARAVACVTGFVARISSSGVTCRGGRFRAIETAPQPDSGNSRSHHCRVDETATPNQTANHLLRIAALIRRRCEPHYVLRFASGYVPGKYDIK